MLLPALLGLVCVILLALVLIPALKKGPTAEPVPQEELEAGRAYLEQMAEKDPAKVDEVLKQRRAERLAKEREALLKKLYDGEVDVWSMFEDFVLLGDSRAVGFYYYDFLDKSRVLADGGNTIRNVADHMDEIVALNPSYIYLCYGLNDVSIGFWPTKEQYAKEMLQVVQDLKKKVPNAMVVISSILPARDPAFERASKWREIPDYSAAVEQMCKENGIVFVNNDKISAEHADLWGPDGIHLQIPFYNYWGSNLIIATLEAQNPEGEVTEVGNP